VIALKRVFTLVASLSLSAAASVGGATSRPSIHPATTTTTTAATTRPAHRNAVAAKVALRAAVAALTKEYERFQRDPIQNGLRQSCNYFLDHPDPDLAPDVLLAVLANASGGDPHLAAYLKWQLLSGLPETPDDEAAAKQLLVAYRSAPLPRARPGASADDQRRLERFTQSARQGDESDIERRLDAAVADVRRLNAPVLAYRDELYRRLPKTPETFAAAMDDLLARANAVADGKDLVKALAKDVRAWLASADAPPARQTLAALARAARRLADTKGPQYYQSPYWNERTRRLAWRKTRAGVDSGHALKDLAVLLEEQCRRPPPVPKLDIKGAAAATPAPLAPAAARTAKK
jgi:hypothetical protein